jgi:hypothetical protein
METRKRVSSQRPTSSHDHVRGSGASHDGGKMVGEILRNRAQPPMYGLIRGQNTSEASRSGGGRRRLITPRGTKRLPSQSVGRLNPLVRRDGGCPVPAPARDGPPIPKEAAPMLTADIPRRNGDARRLIHGTDCTPDCLTRAGPEPGLHGPNRPPQAPCPHCPARPGSPAARSGTFAAPWSPFGRCPPFRAGGSGMDVDPPLGRILPTAQRVASLTERRIRRPRGALVSATALLDRRQAPEVGGPAGADPGHPNYGLCRTRFEGPVCG